MRVLGENGADPNIADTAYHRTPVGPDSENGREGLTRTPACGGHEDTPWTQRCQS